MSSRLWESGRTGAAEATGNDPGPLGQEAQVITFPGSSPDNTSAPVCGDTVQLGRLFLVRMVRALLRHPKIARRGRSRRVWELSGPSGL